MKKILSTSLRVVISFSLLGLLFWFMRKDIGDIWITVSRCNLQFIALACLFYLINLSMMVYRLKIVFAGEALNLSFFEALRLSFIGFFFNNFMPTSIGGDIIKAHYASLINKKRMRSYASVFMDRFIGLYTFLIIAMVALIFDRGRLQIPMVRPIVFMLAVLGATAFIVITNKKIAGFVKNIFMHLRVLRLNEKLSDLYNIIYDYKNRKIVVIKAILISIFAQVIYFAVIYLCFRSLGAFVSLSNVLLIMSVVVFVSMVPSIGGLGVREGAMVVLFSSLVGRESAFAVSLILLCGLFIVSIIGGGVYVWWSIAEIKEGGFND